MGGCDKTTPALLMGAVSMDLPRASRPGPYAARQLERQHAGLRSDTWKYWAELRAGNITEEDWQGVEDGIACSPGHCMTMGTASTMTAAVEALGMCLSGYLDSGARLAPRADGEPVGQAHRRNGLGRPRLRTC